MISRSEFPLPSQGTVNLHLDYLDQVVVIAALVMLTKYGRHEFDPSRLPPDIAEKLDPTMDTAQALIDRLAS